MSKIFEQGQDDKEIELSWVEKERDLDKVIPGTTDYVRPEDPRDLSNEELDETQ